MKVRCTWCEQEFNEEDIIVKGEEEHCPLCLKKGCLMDIVDGEWLIEKGGE